MRRWGNWAVVVACVAVAALPLVPPAADSAAFSATRAMSHVNEIGKLPHPIGSVENQRVRSYLIQTLADLGLSPQTQVIEAMDYFGTPGNTVDVVNVMTRVEGTGDGRAIALVAHYDTVPATPGANDNSTSVAILLEIAAALVAGEPIQNDVILLFTDGEEPNPRFGSKAFVDDHPWFDDVAFVVNLESSGSAGGSILAEASGPTRWLIGIVSASADYPLAFSFFTEIASLIGGFGTDFDPFRDAEVPGVAFAYLHGSPVYHTDRDSLENVGVRSVQQQGSNTLAMSRYLAEIDLTPPPDGSDSVFFTVARWVVVRYPAALSLPMALAALVILGVAVFRGPRLASLFKGAGLAFGGFVAAAVVGVLLWMLITTFHTTPGIPESYFYLALLLALTGGLWWLVARRMDPEVVVPGVVGVWVVFALVTGGLAPGTNYVFTWPALVGSLYVLARSKASIWSLLLVSLTSLAVTVPIIDFLFQMAQPRPGNPDSELIPVAGLATGLAFLVIALIYPVSRAANGQEARSR